MINLHRKATPPIVLRTKYMSAVLCTKVLRKAGGGQVAKFAERIISFVEIQHVESLQKSFAPSASLW